MTRGILYYVWGGYNKAQLKRSIDTAVQFGYPFTVVESKNNLPKYRHRADMFSSSPYDITLHLDTDTQIKGNLDYGFDMAEKYGLACCIAPAASAYKAAEGDIRKVMPKDLPQYNCGVIFFSKDSKPTFARYGELLREHSEGADNDQPYFSQAVYDTINPYILPNTWNYRPHLRYVSKHYFGDLKILHSR